MGAAGCTSKDIPQTIIDDNIDPLEFPDEIEKEVARVEQEINNNTEIFPAPGATVPARTEQLFEYQGYQPAAVEPVAAGAPIAASVIEQNVQTVDQYGNAIVHPVAAMPIKAGHPEMPIGFDTPEEAMEYHNRQHGSVAHGSVVQAPVVHAEHIRPEIPHHFSMTGVDVSNTAAVQQMKMQVEAYNKHQQDMAFQNAISGIAHEGGQNLTVLEPQSGYVEPLPVAQIEHTVAYGDQPVGYAEPQPLPMAHGHHPAGYGPNAVDQERASVKNMGQQPIAPQMGAPAEYHQAPSSYHQQPTPVDYHPQAVPAEVQQPMENPQELQQPVPLENPEEKIADAVAAAQEELPEITEEPQAEPAKKKKKWGLF